MSVIRVILGSIGALLFFSMRAFAADGPISAQPAPAFRIIAGQPLAPGQQNQAATVEGMVIFAGRHGSSLYLEIGSHTGRVRVTVEHENDLPADLLLNSHIRAQGICLPVRNSANGEIVGSLLATNLDNIAILQLPQEAWQRYPLCAIGNIQTNALEHIIHLHGLVKALHEGGFVIADETGQMISVSTMKNPRSIGATLEVLGLWEQRGSEKIFQSICYRPVIGADNPASLPTLTTTEQVRWLNPQEANRGYPVKVRVVVTFLLGSGQSAAGNLQDGTGGIYAWHLVSSPSGATVKPGDYCEIEGTTSAGSFSPGIDCRRLRVLGRGEFPEPVRPAWDELASGSLDAQWVELEGIVLTTTTEHLEIAVRGGDISCFIPDRTDLQHFQDAVVLVRGVVVADWNSSRHVMGLHLNLPSEEFISLEIPPLEKPFSLPAKQISDLLFYDPGESGFRREKIVGQIIGERAGVYYLTDGTNGLRLMPKENLNLTAGDIVEAVGFPEIDNSTAPPILRLREAVIRVTGRKPLPKPLKIASADLVNSEYDSTYVQIEAILVRSEIYGADQVLELEAGIRTLFARLNRATGMIPGLRPGSRLELTGVDVLNSGNANSYALSGPAELLLNSPADLKVLELPSWWTTEHSITVVSGMTVVILLGLIWIALLRQQVGRRTAQLWTVNRSLEAEIAERGRAENELLQARLQHLVEQERTRIARDIHDELGSNLSQIRLLSEMTISQNNSMNVGKISAKALEATNVLDEIVWAIEPRNDTLESLLNYLFNFASDFLSLAGIRFRIDAPMRIPRYTLTTQIRHQLYMAFKETLTNIVNHANATEVWIRLILETNSACFIVEDNGGGFDLSAGAEKLPGASGLNNMRIRFSEIGGEFELESSVGKGTRVRFRLPLNGKL